MKSWRDLLNVSESTLAEKPDFKAFARYEGSSSGDGRV